MRAAAIIPACLAALALLVGGCGGGSSAGGVASGAEITPASTAVFISIRTDFEGDGWEDARRHAQKFPAVGRAFADLAEELEGEGIDFERDVRPTLGPELDIAVVAAEAGGEDAIVALTQPADEAKLDALVAKADDLAYEMVDGWAVIAKKRSAIDAFQAAAEDGSLAETDAWEQATGGLPDEALVAGYMNGSALTRDLGTDAPDGHGFGAALRALVPDGGFPSVGFAAYAEDEGIRVHAASTMEAQEFEDYEASLPAEVPAGALAFVSWNDAAEHLRDALRRAGDADPEVDRYVAQAELALGLSLERDLLPLLAGEGALVLYPIEAPQSRGSGMGWSGHPSVALVLEVEDEEKAVATIDRAVERASGFLSSIERTQDVDLEGVRARSVSLEGLDLRYAAFDGKLVIATGRDAIAGIAAGEEKLADDATFTAARAAAGAPDETAGFAFVDFAAAAAAFAPDAPAAADRNLDPLGPLFVYGTSDDDELVVEGFIAIE